MPPNAHAVLGASGARRWMNCPGSVALSAGMPNKTTVYAREGTAAHTLAERALQTGLPAIMWLETLLEADGEDVEVTEEMAEAVQVYVDYVRSLATDDECCAIPYIEQAFTLEDLIPPEDMFGTADAVVWNVRTRVLDVVDLKYGRGVAVGIDTPQLPFYALGAVVALKVRPDVIRVTIVQPRAPHVDGPIRSRVMTWDELVTFKRDLFQRAVATQDPDAPLVVGEWCRFCPAQALCPAQRAYALEVAQSEFMDGLAPPRPETLTPAELATVLGAADVLEEWLRAVEAHAFNLLERGLEVPGYKLVEKRATRKWADEEKAIDYLTDRLGDDAAYTEPKLISPAQAEKKLKEQKQKLPPELVVKQSSGRKLAIDADARPALLPSVVEDFEVVE